MIKTVEIPSILMVLVLSGNPSTSENTLRSVVETAKSGGNTLLVIDQSDDPCGQLETVALRLVADDANADYFKPPTDLGFAASINLVLAGNINFGGDILLLNGTSITPKDVAELSRVMQANEKHGIVQPRSNRGLTASIPPSLSATEAFDPEYSEFIFNSANELLPGWTITPVATGSCVLIRGLLFANYGPFNEDYFNEDFTLMDFSWRINRLGYSAITANRVFVQASQTGVGSQQLPVDEIGDIQLLRGRYPHHDDSLAHFYSHTIEPLDWFSDRIFSTGRRKILIDLFHIALAYNGSTRNAISFLEGLTAKSKEFTHLEFTISSSADAIAFFDLGQYGFEIIENGLLKDRYDLGLSIAPVSDSRQIFALNKHCVKWVFCHFDIIGIRVNTLLEFNYARRQVVLDSLTWADRIISISKSSITDLESYFGSQSQGISDRTKIIYEGVHKDSLPETTENDGYGSEADAVLERNNFVLVIGNDFPHKHFTESLTALAIPDFNFEILAFGRQGTEKPVSGVTGVKGGHLSDAQVTLLYRRAKCVVFPSTYEGFGLPTVEAASAGNHIVLFDNAVNHEVSKQFGIADKVHFFTWLSDLPRIVTKVAGEHELKPVSLRSLDEYNEDILKIALDEVKTSVDLKRLNKRVWEFRRVDAYSEEGRKAAAEAQQELMNYKTSLLGKLTEPMQRFFQPTITALSPVIHKLRKSKGK